MSKATGEIEEHITEKYEIKKRLGKGLLVKTYDVKRDVKCVSENQLKLVRYRIGSYGKQAYGIVWKAIDKKSGEVVALKKIFDAFRNQTDAQRTFREIMFLQEFGDHPNVVKLHNVLKAENDKDIYLVFEFMDTDLHNVIKRGNILKDVHKRYIMYQMLKATKYMHSGNVIHRDQKPSNVLLDGECFVKLCDFGLARSLSQIVVDEQGDPNLTEYVATRWYRAPEILLASQRYTKGVDMWSLGCILGEMLLGKPLFPGSSTLNQIERIMSAIEMPSKEDIDSINSAYGASVLERASKRPRKPLMEMMSECPDDAIDLLKKLLRFNPEKRFTADQALKHPYVRRFHNPAEEKSIGRNVIPPLSDEVQLTVEEYRTRLYEMIMNKKLERRRRRRDDHRHIEEKRKVEEDHKEQIPPPSEPVYVQDSPSPTSPGIYPHKILAKQFPEKGVGCKPPIGPGQQSEIKTDNKQDTKSGAAVTDYTTSNAKVHTGVAFGKTTHQVARAPAPFQGRPKSQGLVRQRSAELFQEPVNTRQPHRGASAPNVAQHTGTYARTNTSGFSRQAGAPMITRDDRHPFAVSSSKLIPHSRAGPPGSASGKERVVRPTYGRKQFDNGRNNPSAGAHKAAMGGYGQNYGTITASGLASIHARKW